MHRKYKSFFSSFVIMTTAKIVSFVQDRIIFEIIFTGEPIIQTSTP